MGLKTTRLQEAIIEHLLHSELWLLFVPSVLCVYVYVHVCGKRDSCIKIKSVIAFRADEWEMDSNNVSESLYDTGSVLVAGYLLLVGSLIKVLTDLEAAFASVSRFSVLYF